jgi:tetratricopeptide (TPR) repeat protein
MRQLLYIIILLFSFSIHAQNVGEEVYEFVMKTAGSPENVVPVLDSLIASTPKSDEKYPTYRYLRLEFEREPTRLSTHIADLEYAIYYADSTNTFFGEPIDDPSNYSDLYNMLGIFQKYSGAVNKAIKSFDKAAEMDPTNELVWLNLASAYEHQGNLSAAFNTLNNYVSDDTLFTFYFIRAAYHLQQNSLDKAEQELAKCLEDAQGQEGPKVLLLAAKFHLANNEKDSACNYLNLAEDAYFKLNNNIAAYSTNDEWAYWTNYLMAEQNELQELKQQYCE